MISKLIKTLIPTIVLYSLTACGGGGGGTPSPTVPTNTTPYAEINITSQAATNTLFGGNVTTTDADGDSLSNTINWGDGTIDNVVQGENTPVAHLYKKEGDYNLTVASSDGIDTTKIQYPITVKQWLPTNGTTEIALGSTQIPKDTTHFLGLYGNGVTSYTGSDIPINLNGFELIAVHPGRKVNSGCSIDDLTALCGNSEINVVSQDLGSGIYNIQNQTTGGTPFNPATVNLNGTELARLELKKLTGVDENVELQTPTVYAKESSGQITQVLNLIYNNGKVFE